MGHGLPFVGQDQRYFCFCLTVFILVHGGQRTKGFVGLCTALSFKYELNTQYMLYSFMEEGCSL